MEAKYTFREHADTACRCRPVISLCSRLNDDPYRHEDARHVAGIEYVKPDGATNAIRCRRWCSRAAPIETSRHLLINKSADHPQGLANSSGQVGRNVTSHFGVTVTGIFPQLRGRDGSNDDGTDYYHALITGMYWDKPNPNFDGTYQIQCGSGIHPLGLSIRTAPGFGSKLKREIRELNNTHAGLGMQGTTQPSAQTFVDLDMDRRDKHGLPLPRVHLKYGSNDVAMASDMVATAEEVIRAAGGRVYSSPGEILPSKLNLDTNHWVGSARMGTDPSAASSIRIAGATTCRICSSGTPRYSPRTPKRIRR